MTSYHVEAGCVAVTYFMTHKLFNAWHWNFKRSKTNCCHQTRAFVFWNKTILKMMMHHIWNFEQLMLITRESCFQMSWGRRKTAWGQLCNSRSQQIFLPDTSRHSHNSNPNVGGALHSSARQHTQSKSVKLQGLCNFFAAFFSAGIDGLGRRRPGLL